MKTRGVHKNPDRRAPKDQGAILITTLLVMTLMAAISIVLIEDIRFAIKRASNTQAYAQADWFAASAEDFAVSYLTREFAELESAEINQRLRQNAPFILPIDGGALTLNIRDGSQCFLLSRLENAPARLEFENLLIGIGVNDFRAERISYAAADWIDRDRDVNNDGAEDFTYLTKQPAYRAANAPFTSVMEMRAIHGMSEDIYQSLRPYICVRPQNLPSAEAKLNLNTINIAHKPLLAAALGGGLENEALAKAIILSRPLNGYLNAQDVLDTLGEGEPLPEGTSLENLTLVPNHILAEVNIQYRNARRVIVMEFAIDEAGISRVSRYSGAEALRPVPIIDAQTGLLRNPLNALSSSQNFNIRQPF